MIDALEVTANRERRLSFYRDLAAILDVPIVPVDIRDGKVCRLVERLSGPGEIERVWGAAGTHPDAPAAMFIDPNRDDVPYVIAGPFSDDGAPGFVCPLNGQVAIYRSARSALSDSDEHRQLAGWIVVPDDNWIRPLPTRFAALPDAAKRASHYEVLS